MTRKQRVRYVIGLIVFFVVGYIVSFFTMTHPLNVNEYQMCEKIAIDIYEQKEDVITNIPDGIIITMKANEITVRKSGFNYGVVKGTIEDDFLTLDRDREIPQIIGINISIAILTSLMYLIISAIHFEDRE